VPISQASLRYALVALVFMFIGIFGGVFTSNLETMILSGYSLESFVDNLSKGFVLILITILAVVVVGLLQTRFLFRIGTAKEIVPSKKLGQRLVDAVLNMAGIILIFASVILIARFIWPIFLNVIVSGSSGIASSLSGLFSFINFSLSGLFFIIALSVWLRDRYRFMLGYRMSKAEINSEGRE
jgi:flagellar biosynthesis protein FlhB